MILYILYRIGYFLANLLPLRANYAIAAMLADIYCTLSPKDRRTVAANLEVVLGGNRREGDADRISREVFRNFAKYLAEFFRFSKIDTAYIKRRITIKGMENIDKARALGKGVIILSAHIGNWELGGFVLTQMRQPMAAVVLTHRNKRIDDFFTRQRLRGKLIPIEIGASLRQCYRTLMENGILALLGDRDFSASGMKTKFFGRDAVMPKGPAVLSQRLGSPIVPAFMVREDGDRLRLTIEEPILPRQDLKPEDAALDIAGRYLPVIESYIRRYPSQWYVFRRVWNGDGKDRRPDTII
jgi:KDO2-lipid IV(A) lauroyltransferase